MTAKNSLGRGRGSELERGFINSDNRTKTTPVASEVLLSPGPRLLGSSACWTTTSGSRRRPARRSPPSRYFFPITATAHLAYKCRPDRKACHLNIHCACTSQPGSLDRLPHVFFYSDNLGQCFGFCVWGGDEGHRRWDKGIYGGREHTVPPLLFTSESA